MRIQKLLSKEYNLTIPTTLLFGFPNTKGLAEFVVRELMKERPPTADEVSTSVHTVLQSLHANLEDLGDSWMTRSFMDLGLESLDFMRIQKLLSKEYNLTIPTTLLFGFPNTKGLAEFVVRELMK